MDRAKRDRQGDLTAWVCAHILNGNPFASRSVTPAECHPFKPRPAALIVDGNQVVESIAAGTNAKPEGNHGVSK